jgi:nitrate/TMAO reductase-like tetraheme cytochrome c subunit
MKTTQAKQLQTMGHRCVSLLLLSVLFACTARSESAGPAGSGKDDLVRYALAAGESDKSAAAGAKVDAYAEHEKLFVEDEYPSAATCRTCHPSHYREWSVSSHAYAQLSPVFNAMQATVTKLTSGSNGDFCIRCHTQVGMNLGEPTFMSNMDRNPTSREGISCIVCHRMNTPYGKVSGRFALVKGGILDPVFGPTGNAELKRVLGEPNTYRVVTNNTTQGRKIHTDVKKFFQLTESAFCGTCHDVTLMNGFRLEEAFSSFKNSPAAKAGTSCQDCHMGLEQGIKSGYAMEPAAVIGGVPTKPRKRTNHMFPGPDYSIIHPGLFPHNDKAAALATMREWLTFDHKAGWGTDKFEDTVPPDAKFPKRWESIDDRYDARAILDEQFKLLAELHVQRVKLLRAAYQLGDFVVRKADKKGIKFAIKFNNATDGHNAPTGFDAERPLWMHVTVTDPAGKVVFESGDLDPNGDVRDLHSSYVHHGELPLDKYLFSLQSKFITQNLRGSEREQVLAVNYSVDPLPFIRPEPFSTILQGRPNGARIQRRGIEPLGHRWAEYKIDGKALTGDGPYKVDIEVKAGMVPINLITEIQVVGFDYNMSPRAVADAVKGGHSILWKKQVTIPLDGTKKTLNLADIPDSNQDYAKSE